MSLKIYRKKRNFNLTKEPNGNRNHSSLLKKNRSTSPSRSKSKSTSKSESKSKSKTIFVIHKHAASHLHYDLRLKMNNVLKSWAVPKGPSLNPDVKRLAVNVEDHPLAYKTFEGTIPEHQYGAGTVMIWDQGTWSCETDPNDAYRKGDITFQLKGKKLRGFWKLIKIKSKAGAKNTWLLIKVKDKYANQNLDILETKSKSVKSKRAIEEIAEVKKKDYPIDAKSLDKLSGAKKAVLPKKFTPQLAFLTDKIPESDQWLHEIKLDGYRIVCIIHAGKVQFLSRNGKDWSRKFPKQGKELSAFPCNNAILDGEMVVLDKGVSSFELLQNSLSDKNISNVIYYVFDLPFYNQYDLTDVALIERKRLLADIFKRWKKRNCVFFSEHIQGKGKEILSKACQFHLEGIISKEISSGYSHKRSRHWLKSKCILRQEFVIGGFTRPQGGRKYFGALLVGYYDSDKRFIYCGKVGTGFNELALYSLAKKMQPLIRKDCPFVNQSNIKTKQVTWLDPKLVCELEFLTWTKDGILRHSSFLGLRLDKDPVDVSQEANVKELTKVKRRAKPKTYNIRDKQIISEQQVVISHPDKIIGPTKTISKGALAKYYSAIADKILPHIVNRPLLIRRCHSSKESDCFYQKHYNKAFPPSIYPIQIEHKADPSKEKSKNSQSLSQNQNPSQSKGSRDDNFLMIKDKKGLLALIQLDVVEIHPWGSQATSLEKPDRIIFDLDPSETVPWNRVIKAAEYIYKELKTQGLKSFVKTTGGKGLHIVIPIKPELDWSEIKNIAHQFALAMEQKYPTLFVATQTKSKRLNKIFIDYLRNGRGATAVAAYSTRAKTGAPISFPVSWKQLSKIRSAEQFNLMNNRLSYLVKQQPWKEFFTCKQKITKEMKYHWSKK